MSVGCGAEDTRDDNGSDAGRAEFRVDGAITGENADVGGQTTLVAGGRSVPASARDAATNEQASMVGCESQGDERCNGFDDDCDGHTDEIFRLGVECQSGIGACATDGQTICGPDGTVICDAMPTTPVDELCNAIDDDCDGQVDEVFSDLGRACTVREGNCRRDGTLRCSDDRLTVHCDVHGLFTSDELCDGQDNDCDTKVDEGFHVGALCAEGEGLCRRGGFIVCLDDGMAECDAEPAVAVAEVCDGADNDCDGRMDEDFGGGVCTVGIGGCAREGVRKCDRAGRLVCDAVEGSPKPELCNGFDDDCDERIDEAYPELGAPCSRGQGTCRNDGIVRCSPAFDSGYTFTGIEQALPVDELTEGGFEVCWRQTYDQRGVSLAEIKDSCHLDKVLLGCRRTGQPTLTIAAMGNHDDVFFDVGEGQNAIHQHNGVAWYFDEDSSWGFAPLPEGVNGRSVQRRPCDLENRDAPLRLCWETEMGQMGRGYRCGASRGASVQWERVIFHRPVGPRAECSVAAGPADPVDACNGVDEDCDGTIDEGAAGTGEACDLPNLGPCESAITACNAAGEITCVPVPVEPTVETCNGRDDDCDGAIDEDFMNVGEPCQVGIGACRSPGVLVCGVGAHDAGLAFEGVRNNVPQEELDALGFEPCFSGRYSESVDGVDRVIAGCELDEWVLACRPAGSASYTVAATGLKTEILTDAGDRVDGAHAHNGVDWYFSHSHSIGFAAAGTGVRRMSCDTLNEHAEKRLCWHTRANQINGGYRCGAMTGLNRDADWERIILHRAPGGRVECTASPGSPQPIQPCDDIDDDCDGGTEDSREVVHCDGVDDDCDGDLDEGRVVVHCDEIDDDCDGDEDEARRVVPCDNIDDDCDGDADEIGPITPCDDVDDDCDGRLDEGGVGERCVVPDVAPCQMPILQCDDDGQLVCQTVPIDPQLEGCNGRDDDCDGRVDEDFVNLGASCEVGEGRCRAQGFIECAPSPQIVDLAFYGVRTNVPVETLADAGFEPCFSTPYNSANHRVEAMIDSCHQDEWVVACRRVDAVDYLVAATGLRVEILTDVGQEIAAVHAHNGVDWYFNDDYSMGYAASGTPVERRRCDMGNEAAEQRLCWHTTNGLLTSGYRCGAHVLNMSGAWERIVLHRPYIGRAVCRATPGEPQQVTPCDQVDDDCDGDAEERQTIVSCDSVDDDCDGDADESPEEGASCD
ncbi:MAG: MopE-related protein [Myxococcota bacterium]|nr:MopE-related protein [Myxococcota bacterium]